MTNNTLVSFQRLCLQFRRLRMIANILLRCALQNCWRNWEKRNRYASWIQRARSGKLHNKRFYILNLLFYKTDKCSWRICFHFAKNMPVYYTTVKIAVVVDIFFIKQDARIFSSHIYAVYNTLIITHRLDVGYVTWRLTVIGIYVEFMLFKTCSEWLWSPIVLVENS